MNEIDLQFFTNDPQYLRYTRLVVRAVLPYPYWPLRRLQSTKKYDEGISYGTPTGIYGDLPIDPYDG